MKRVASIRRRLIVRLLAGTLAVCLTTVGVVYWYLRQEIVEQYDWALLSKARALAGVVATAPEGIPIFPLRAESMPEYHPQPRDTDFFQIWRADQTVLARSPSLGTADLQVSKAPTLSESHGFTHVTLPGGRVGRTAWLRFPSPQPLASTSTNTPRPTDMMIAVATSGEEFDETIGHLVLALVTAVIVISAGTLFVVVVVVSHGLRPVREVAEAAGRIEADTLSFRFELTTLPAELRPIADRLNALLERLETAFRREKTFTANVAHELRTPIAELKTSAEVALKWPDDPSLTTRGLKDAVAVADRMEAVVRSLLSLARYQAGREPVRVESLNLAQLVSDAWRPYAPSALARQLIAEFDTPEPTIVHSDRTLLQSLVGNLLSNAVTYAPQGDHIRIRCQTSESQVTLSIQNTNPGLTESDLLRLNEPFWRKEAARSDPARAGLGLTLVTAYAAALGAAVRFEIICDAFKVSLQIPSHLIQANHAPAAVQVEAPF